MTSLVLYVKKSRFWPKWIIGQNMNFWNSVTLEGFPLGLTVKLTFFSWLLTLPDFLGFDPSFESRTSNNAKIIKKGLKNHRWLLFSGMHFLAKQSCSESRKMREKRSWKEGRNEAKQLRWWPFGYCWWSHFPGFSGWKVLVKEREFEIDLSFCQKKRRLDGIWRSL